MCGRRNFPAPGRIRERAGNSHLVDRFVHDGGPTTGGTETRSDDDDAAPPPAGTGAHLDRGRRRRERRADRPAGPAPRGQRAGPQERDRPGAVPGLVAGHRRLARQPAGRPGGRHRRGRRRQHRPCSPTSTGWRPGRRSACRARRTAGSGPCGTPRSWWPAWCCPAARPRRRCCTCGWPGCDARWSSSRRADGSTLADPCLRLPIPPSPPSAPTSRRPAPTWPAMRDAHPGPGRPRRRRGQRGLPRGVPAPAGAGPDRRPGDAAVLRPARHPRRDRPSATTSAAATCTTTPATRWSSTGGPTSRRAFYRATRTEPMGVALRRRFGFERGAITAYEDEHLQDRAEAERRSRILAGEIERPAGRPDARHRRHDPARAGRDRARRRHRDRLRAGRPRHRQDRGRPAPRGVPALRPPRPAAPRRRAGRRAQPRVPVLHRARCCRRSARSTCGR